MVKWKFWEKRDASEQPKQNNFDYLTYQLAGSFAQSRSLKLSAVYRCVEILSDSVAELPVSVMRVDSDNHKVELTSDPVYKVLNGRPNQRMTKYTFFKMLVASVYLKGNGYAYIRRDTKGKPQELVFLPDGYVNIYVPENVFEPVYYQVRGVKGKVYPHDMIHIINYSNNGVQGISTLAYAAQSLGLATNAEKAASNFFESGCNIGGTLSVDRPLTAKQKEDLKNSWHMAFGSGSGGSNGVAVLEGGMSFSPITVNPKDSMMLESRQYSVVEIARWFGISPVKLFDLSKSSYSTIEATQLAFLTDTLQPLLEKIENELTTKLFPEGNNVIVKFNTDSILRADKTSLSSYYSTLLQAGVMTVNEVRAQLDLPHVEDGDENYIQAQLISLKNAKNSVPSDKAINNAGTETNQPGEDKNTVDDGND